MKNLFFRYRFYIIACVLLVLFFSQASSPPEDTKGGTLTIYRYPTQIGVVARREYQDSQGRTEKMIYYWAKIRYFSEAKSLTHDKLLVKFTHIYKYPSGYKKTVTQFDHVGVRKYEMRYRKKSPRPTTWIHYNYDGSQAIGVRGEIPSDVNFAIKWGKFEEGIQCGIALSKATGSTTGRVVHVTLKNFGKQISISPCDLELFNAQGELVAPRGHQTFNKLDLYNIYDKKNTLKRKALHGYVSLYDRHYYLPVGIYTLTAKVYIGAKKTLIKSPTFSVVITTEKDHRQRKK